MLICNGDRGRNQELLGIVVFGCAIFLYCGKVHIDYPALTPSFLPFNIVSVIHTESGYAPGFTVCGRADTLTVRSWSKGEKSGLC